jgi:hypothetical protein
MKTKTFVAVLALVVAANGCLVLQAFSPVRLNHIQPPTGTVQEVRFNTGDLVFRRGYGLVSDLLRKTGRREQRFSHAGMVWIEQGKTYVLHMAAEPYSGLNRTAIADFISPDVASEAAVYRLPLNAMSQHNLFDNLNREQLMKRPFDDAFELDNGEPQYCTEWIAGLLIRSGYEVQLPLDFVSPDDLYFQPGSQLVCTFGGR